MATTEIIDAHLQYLSPQMIRSLSDQRAFTSIILHPHQMAIVENCGYMIQQMIAERPRMFGPVDEPTLSRGSSMRYDSIKTIAGIRIVESADILPDVALLMSGSQEIVRIVNLGRTGPSAEQMQRHRAELLRVENMIEQLRNSPPSYFLGVDEFMGMSREMGAGILTTVDKVLLNNIIEVNESDFLYSGQRVSVYSSDMKHLRGWCQITEMNAEEFLVKFDHLPVGVKPGDLIVLPPEGSRETEKNPEEPLPTRRIRRKDAS